MTFGWVRDLADLIRDVRLSVFLCVSSLILLLVPYQKLDLQLPSIIIENAGALTVIGILSFANLVLHFLQFLSQLVRRHFFKLKRRSRIKEVFLDLNFGELCVLYYCTQAGIRAFKATPNSVIIMSLKAKGCIHHISGIQSAVEMHFQIFDDIFDIVRQEGKDRFPKEFLDQYNWDEQIRDTFIRATDWRVW
ncbi:super-infection exclusion protein B [uncultured Roseovarius sp.]|uniref:super-infection exclusion protein B n=1 Tax=uncultured Roseovarius sp. TaxID=293344 RepID=UPI002614AFE6|nr:super-infection exclusion protein B [uncultured Roseovarius sp.]